MIYVLDKSTEALLTLLDNATPNTCPFYNDRLIEKLNGFTSFEFDVPAEHESAQHLTEENLIAIKDNVLGEWRVFAIKEITEVHSKALYKNVYCELSNTELIDEVILTEVGGVTKSAQDYVDSILNGTRWTGSVDPSFNNNILIGELQFKNALEALSEVVDKVNCDIVYNFEITGNKITKREVKLTNRGRNIGRRLEYNKDLNKVERIVNTDNLKTAIVPLGKAEEIEGADPNTPKPRLTIASVNGGVLWVGDEDARNTWGRDNGDGTKNHRLFKVIFDSVDDPNTLMNKGLNYLNLYKTPRVTYKADAINLQAILKGSSDEINSDSILLGDTVAVIDNSFKPSLRITSRVIQVERSLSDEDKSKLILGNFKPSIVSKDVGAEVAKLNDKVDRLPTPDFNIDLVGGKNYVPNSKFKEGLRYWNATASGSLVYINDLTGFSRAFNVDMNYAGYFSIQQDIPNPNTFLNKKLTVSAYVKYANVVAGANSWEKFRVVVHYWYKDSNGVEQAKYNTGKLLDGTSNGWERVNETLPIGLDENLDIVEIIRIRIYIGFDNAYGQYWVTGIKAELGEILTDYSEYPNDAIGNGFYEQIEEQNDNEIKTTEGYVYISESDGIWVYDRPTGSNPTEAVILKGGKLGLAKWDGSQWVVTSFIKNGEVYADAITGGSMLADRVYGGTLKLGNITGRAGKLEILDSDGNPITVLSADKTEYSEVVSDAVFGKNVGLPPINLVGATNEYMPNYDHSDSKIKFWIDSIGGDDTNDGTEGAPLKSIQEAINRLPKYVEHTVEIYVARGEYRNDLVIQGFNGGGKISILGSQPLNGRHLYVRCDGGNSINGSYHIVEIEAYDRYGTNIALNKARATNAPTGSGNLDISRINNGNKTTTDYFDLGTGDKWVRIDFGSDVDLYGVKVWHYYGDGRTYISKRAYVYKDDGSFGGYFYSSLPEHVGEDYYIEDTAETSNGNYADYRPVLSGRISVNSSNVDVSIEHLRVENPFNGYAPIYALNSKYVNVTDCVAIASYTGSQPYSIYYSRSTGRVVYSEASDADTAGIIGAYGSQLDAWYCRGHGDSQDYGVFAYSSSMVSVYSSIPNGISSDRYSSHGGLIVYQGTAPDGKDGVAIGGGVKTYVETFNSTVSGTWEKDYSCWYTMNNDAIQGDWSGGGLRAGFWFFGDIIGTIKSQGGTITKVRAYIQRKDTTHGYSSAVTHYLRPHPHVTKPSGTPTIDTSKGYNTVALTRGQGAWVDLTGSLAHFESNWAKGIYIYTTNYSDTYYSRCEYTAKLEITYDR